MTGTRRSFLSTLAAVGSTGVMAAPLARADDALGGLAEALRGDALDDDAAWEAVRGQFRTAPGLIHLNTGTLGLTPGSVLDVVEAAQRAAEADPVGMVFGPLIAEMEAVRADAAALLGADFDEVALTRNTTEGLNAVASGIDFRAGDEILTTDHEHPGGLVGWQCVAERAGASIVVVPMPAPAGDVEQILRLFEERVTPRTRVISLSHVETITGLRMPVAAIADRIARPREILLVCDGAQAPGMIAVGLHALGVDAYASSSHKWLLAPKGSGLLYIRAGARDRIRPPLLHSGPRSYSASSGTRDAAGILGHGAAIAFHNAIGRDRIEARCLSLNRHLRDALAEHPAFRMLTPDANGLDSGMLTVSLDRGDASTICTRLRAERGVVLKPVPIADLNAIRISTHLYNTRSEIERAVALLAAAVG